MIGKGSRVGREATDSPQVATEGSTATHLVPAARLSAGGHGGVSRRRFLGAITTGVAATVLDGCNHAPQEEIVPYVRRPPEVVPGVMQYYATTSTRDGYGVGLLAESHAGRPTKIEGHPEHPASLGKTLLQEQAEVLTLYDPDRARWIRHGRDTAPWSAFTKAIEQLRRRWTDSHGAGLHLLLEPTSSPVIRALLDDLRQRLPRAQVHIDPARAPVARWEGTRQTLGAALEPQYDFTQAGVVVDLDANFLAAMPMSIRWALDFANQRDIRRPEGKMSRLYSVEPTLSVTGATADHHLPLRASDVERLGAALLAALGERLSDRVPARVLEAARPVLGQLTEPRRQWVRALAADLAKHRGRSIVIGGERHSAELHAVAIAVNAALGNVGETIRYSESPLIRAGSDAYDIDPLMRDLDAGRVDTLFVLGGNPSYTLPSDHAWSERVGRARERVHLSLYRNETSESATWFVPLRHFLESWGDALAWDGTASLRQPLIRPLFSGASVEEVLALVAGRKRHEGRWLLGEHWIERVGGEEAFVNALRRGIVADTRHARRSVDVNWGAVERSLERIKRRDVAHGLEVDLLSDPRIEDGRMANNAWLQECPEPITKLVWDNAALVSAKLAEQHGLERGDVIELRKGERRIRAPVFVAPGHADDAVVMWLGYGRGGFETVARGVGVDVAPLRTGKSSWITTGVEMVKTGARYELVTTQDTFDMHDRPIVLHKTKHEWRKHPEFAQHHDEAPPTLLPDRLKGKPQWGMSIDLNRCTGCSACVVACQAENNVPVVGKDMVAMGREMLWLRIDTYHEGEGEHAKVLMQPMLCQHCEKAPCEYVCPVNATVHSDDGLNEMVYNRCVGTRFCSSNCPYKVRRFNWYEFNPDPVEPKPMVYNPDVTVRARGVMEKCTYCVQRIRRAQIDAKVEDRPLRDGDVVTACAQACPTNAIVFGLVSDPKSKVSQRHESLRSYGCLSELGTRPRTRYLARITNRNEEMPG